MIEVRACARLHMGLLDLNGDHGRLYGSIGMAIDHPRLILRARKSNSLAVDGLEPDRVFDFADRFIRRFGLPSNAHLTLIESIPAHQGLGSGTQLAIAVGSALALLSGLPMSVKDIASSLGRGIRSGVGISSFDQGGFVVDAGKCARQNEDNGEKIPPALIARHPVPPDWRFIIIIPGSGEGLSGERERKALASLPKPPSSIVDKMCRILLMKMLPSLVEDDINSFGQALTDIQSIVGDSFASVQGGRFASQSIEKIIAFLLSEGAAGAGQSSWGPALYGLVKGDAEAARILDKAKSYYSTLGTGAAFIARPRNSGAEIIEQIGGARA
jgi:beta-ribofuranosylaminobenzene 5'-phosphate synthase